MAAEALAMSDSHDETIVVGEWFRRLDEFTEGKFGFKPGCPAIYGDNQSVLDAINHDDGVNTIHAPPHVQLKLEAVRQDVFDGKISAGKVGTVVNMSDIGTKTLPKIANARCSGMILNDRDGYFPISFKQDRDLKQRTTGDKELMGVKENT